MKNYSVIVGNIGTMDFDSLEIAKLDFDYYVRQSRNGYGKAGGENITLMDNEQNIILDEFTGYLEQLKDGK